jgi:hypothetical protein
MGAKTWMLVIADSAPRKLLAGKPALDRQKTTDVAQALFPKDQLEALPDGDLMFTCPPDNEIVIGCFPGLTVIAAKEFAMDSPSQLPPQFLAHAASRDVFLHAMHSTVDWLAFALWRNGELVRSLSLAPDGGVIEDEGPRLPFELPYWAGEHPAMDPEDVDPDEPPYPFAFHPLDLGEAALKEFFGYQLEGLVDPALLAPETMVLMRFKRKKSWFKLW